MIKITAAEAIKCAYIVYGLEFHYLTKNKDGAITAHPGKPFYDDGVYEDSLDDLPLCDCPYFLDGDIEIEEFINKEVKDCIIGFDIDDS